MSRSWLCGLFLVGICAVSACGHSRGVLKNADNEAAGPTDSIPAAVVQKAIEFIASRVGHQFCQENVRFDAAGSQAHPYLPSWPVDFAKVHPEIASGPCYRMVFRFSVGESPWVDGRIEFFVDGSARVLPDLRVEGLPDCVNQPLECVFPIDRAEAFRLASEAGLEEGLRPWEATFHWMGKTVHDSISGTYVWDIANTRQASPRGERGDRILIDANSGEVLPHGRMGWETIFDAVGNH
jgi:hypothetical protein